jgi:hypothetical protein
MGIITLLTDFGTKDYYVASMKGVILSINPRATLVDIAHHVSPQDIREGAYLLANAYSFFPKGTIHLAVVDPGVGGPRKPILLATPKHFFVGPDNGLFTFVAQKEEVKKAVVLTNSKYFLPRISHTFHGRDLFAPVAAHLSLGVRPEAFGERVRSWSKLEAQEPYIKGDVLMGEVIHVDAFGNLISNIREDQLARFTKGRLFSVRVGSRSIRGMKQGYWEGSKGEVFALIGSGGSLELSVREGNAASALKVKRGDAIKVQRIAHG